MENLLLALTLPLYFLLHLFTSPTINTRTSSKIRAYALSIDQTVINAIPYSVAIGAGIPTLGVLLSPPGSTQQQTWLVLRQIHPVFATVTVYTLVFLTKRLNNNATTTTTTTNPTTIPNHTLLHALNRAYIFATALSTTTHLATLTLMLTSQLTTTVLLPGYSTYFTPMAVFVPPPLFSSHSHSPASISTFAVGAHVFLKYDELFACAALLVWSVAVDRVGLYGGTYGSDISDTTEERYSWKLTVVEYWRIARKLIFWLIVGGPAAAAVQLVKERDEWVFSGEGAEEEETRRGFVVTDGEEEHDGADDGDREGTGERPYVDE